MRCGLRKKLNAVLVAQHVPRDKAAVKSQLQLRYHRSTWTFSTFTVLLNFQNQHQKDRPWRKAMLLVESTNWELQYPCPNSVSLFTWSVSWVSAPSPGDWWPASEYSRTVSWSTASLLCEVKTTGKVVHLRSFGAASEYQLLHGYRLHNRGKKKTHKSRKLLQIFTWIHLKSSDSLRFFKIVKSTSQALLSSQVPKPGGPTGSNRIQPLLDGHWHHQLPQTGCGSTAFQSKEPWSTASDLALSVPSSVGCILHAYHHRPFDQGICDATESWNNLKQFSPNSKVLICWQAHCTKGQAETTGLHQPLVHSEAALDICASK